MSKILFFYVLRSFAVPATLCLFGLCALTMLFMSFDLIGACFDPSSAINFQVAMDFIGGTLSLYLEWLLPAVFLLSTLYTMWQFCRHSELIAMRASGIGMSTVVAPIVLTACLAAGLSYVNTEYIKPISADRAMRIKDSDFKKTGREPFEFIGFATPGTNRSWTIERVDPNNPTTLYGVKITMELPSEAFAYMTVRYEAPIARWLDGVWWLRSDGEKKVIARYFDELKDEVTAPEGFPSVMTQRALYHVTETPYQILLQHAKEDLASARDRKQYRKMRSADGLTRKEKDADSYETYSHYTAPVAIVLVTLFAIPAGIASGRQSVFRGILLALGLFLSYYVLTALAMALAKNDIVTPACAVCLPLICFGSAAIVLFRKVR